MNFNEKLIGLRRAKGLSQEQLASLIDVSRQAISKWETAESQPDLAKLILLSNVFEVSLDELCGRKPESPSALPSPSSKPRKKNIWLCAAALAVGLAIGFAGGVVTAGVFSPQAAQQQLENVTITGLNIYPEFNNQTILVVYSPSIAKDTFRYKVLKTDSNGNVSSFPAIYKDGICTCAVAVDVPQGDFTLHSVINDGAHDYTSGLIKISNLWEDSCSYEELWKKDDSAPSSK